MTTGAEVGPGSALLSRSRAALRRLWDRLTDRRLAGASGEPDVPSMLGPFRVLEVIGSGGSGTVYRCHDPHRERIVAVKRLHPALSSSSGARRRFLHEGRVARSIRDEHVVATHAVLSKHDPPLLVMEFVSGGSLQDRIDEAGVLSVEEIMHVGRDVARGLGAIHARHLVHTDLKPANVLLDGVTGRAKVGDLGLARVLEAHGRATRALPPVGTVSYMSPEQAQGFRLDPRSDLYSLGAVLYAAAAGAPPFPGSSTMAVLRALLGSAPRALRDARPEVPEWLAEIVHELLSKTPALRPASADRVVARFEAHVGPRRSSSRSSDA